MDEEEPFGRFPPGAGEQLPRGHRHAPHRISAASSRSSASSNSSSNSASPLSTTSSLMDVYSPKGSPSSTGPPKLELVGVGLGLAATVSRESLLDELLGDIRRSCATSLASTPTMVSLSEGEGENVFECRLRRSEAELGTLGKLESWSKASQLAKQL